MENEILINRTRNFGLRKVEAQLKNGPVLQRAILGNLRNKPTQFYKGPLNGKENNGNVVKKEILSKLPALSKTHGKENAAVVPKNKKSLEKVVEKMEMSCEETLPYAFSSQMLTVRDIDEEDLKNPQLVSAYVKDIYKYLWELEEQYPVKKNYLEGHKISSRMRTILIDWLVQVHLRFTLLQETLYLTVGIIDRYLQTNKNLTKDKLQLVGVTSMFIASKYEEMYIPEIGDFVYITDKSFTKKEIRLMEVEILSSLKFYIGFPLHLHFLRRDSKAGEVDAVNHNLAKYLMELTLSEYSFSHYKASLVAAASLYLSIKLSSDGRQWDSVMHHYSSYSEEQILPVASRMAALVIKSCSATCKQQASRNKYRSAKLMKISEIPELSPNCKTLKNFAAQASLH